MVTSYNLKGTNLFKPIKLGDKTLQHRVALAPLTRGRNSDEYVLNDYVKDYYHQRSKREGTLIISEAVMISARSAGRYQPPGIFNEEQYVRWKEVIESVHANKSIFYLQLWALGLYADPAVIKEKGLEYLGPSDDIYINAEKEAVAKKAGVRARGLTTQEVQDYIEEYVQAGKKSIELGADGVEIHGANGYLVFQFLYGKLNKRTDQYGGSIENRARFALEIVDRLGEEIGYDKVALRISPYFEAQGEQSDFYDFDIISVYAYLIGELEKRRTQGKEISYLHIVEPRPELIEKSSHYTSDWIYQIFQGVIVRASGYGSDHEKARKDVESDDRTILAYGRHFIANPDLPDRLENDWPSNAYQRDTFYVGGEKGYLDYPEYESK